MDFYLCTKHQTDGPVPCHKCALEGKDHLPNSTYPMESNNEVEVIRAGLPREQLLALMTAILRPHFMLNEQALEKAKEILDLVGE